MMVFTGPSLWAQARYSSPLRDYIRDRSEPEIYRPFVIPDQSPDLRRYVTQYTALKLDPNELARLNINRPRDLRIQIPLDNDVKVENISGSIVLDLFETNIFDSKFQAWTKTDISSENNQKIDYKKGLHYIGNIVGAPNSTVAISIFPDHLMGVLMTSVGDFDLGKYKGTNSESETYILYNHRCKIEKIPNFCHVQDDHLKKPLQINEKPMASQTCKQVKIYFECDFQMYNDFGKSEQKTIDYIASVFNVIAAVYLNERITIVLGDVVVWNKVDPYVFFITSDEYLDEFSKNLSSNNLQWDLAHFITSRDISAGGIATLDVLCRDKELRAAFSNIHIVYQPLTTYTWDVEVISHEMGHNFGSPHTHSCTWPGGAIDGCYEVEGDCTPPAPADPGTIMSYCHLQYSTDLTLGFGPLPGNLIRSIYQECDRLGTFEVKANIVHPSTPTLEICNGETYPLIAEPCPGCIYEWRLNGNKIANQFDNQLLAKQAGAYTLTVTKASCSVISTPVVIKIKAGPCDNLVPGSITGLPEFYCGSMPPQTLKAIDFTGEFIGWESSTDGFQQNIKPEGKTNPLTTQILTQPTCFRAKIKSGSNEKFIKMSCVETHPLPPVDIVIKGGKIPCNNEKVQLIALAPTAVSFQWQTPIDKNIKDLKSGTISFSAKASGDYTVKIEDKFGCENTATIKLEFAATPFEIVTPYTCENEAFTIRIKESIQASQIKWFINKNCNLDPENGFKIIPGQNSRSITLNDLKGGTHCIKAEFIGAGDCNISTEPKAINICSHRFNCTDKQTLTETLDKWTNRDVHSNTCDGLNQINWKNDGSLPGWYVGQADTNSKYEISINTDSGICGYSGVNDYGQDKNPKRALGTYGIENVTPMFVYRFLNSLDKPVKSLKIKYLGQQWKRNSTKPIKDRLDFQYSLDATTIHNGTWKDVNELDFESPQTSEFGTVNGYLPEYQSEIEFTIENLNIPPNTYVWLKWKDFYQGTDAGQYMDALAVDQLEVTVVCGEKSCGPPTQVSATLQTPISAKVVWNNGVSAVNYLVGYKKVGDPKYTLINAGSGNNLVIDNLNPETEYEFVVFSKCSEKDTSVVSPKAKVKTCALIAGGSLTTDAEKLCIGETIDLDLKGSTGKIEAWEFSSDKNFANPTEFSTKNDPTISYVPGQQGYIRVRIIYPGCPEFKFYSTILVMNPTSCTPECENPKNLEVTLTTVNDATITWNPVPNVAEYLISFHKVGSPMGDVLSFNTNSVDFSTLEFSTEYEFFVAAVCEKGDTSSTESIKFKTCDTPNSGILTTDAERFCLNRRINLILMAHSGKIVAWEFSESPDFSKVKNISIQNKDTIKYVLSQTGYVRCKLVNPDCPEFSVYSSVMDVTAEDCDKPCNAPANLKVTLTDPQSVLVSWDKVDGGLSYTLRYRKKGETGYIVVPNITENSFPLPGLEETTQYEIEVRTYCQFDSSQFSRQLIRTCGSLTMGQIITTNNTFCINSNLILQLKGSNGTVQKWEFSEDGSFVNPEIISTTTDKTITYKIKKSGEIRVTVADNNCSLKPTQSTIFAFEAQDCSCPTPIKLEAITIEETDALISWVGTGVNYEVQYRKGNVGEFTSFGFVGQNNAHLDQLIENTTYQIRVKSTCANGYDSEYSEPFQITTKKKITCFTPEGIRPVELTDNAITLAWASSGNAVAYEIKFRKVGETEFSQPFYTEENQYSFISLNPATNYEFVIKSTCMDGESMWSAPFVIGTLEKPLCPLPTEVTAIRNNETQYTIQWVGVPEAVSYSINYRKVGEVIWQGTATRNTSIVLRNLEPGADYEVRVSTYCGNRITSSKGQFTDPIIFTVKVVNSACSAPKNLNTSVGKTTASVSWTNVSGAIGYILYYRKASDVDFKEKTLSSNNYVFNSLEKGATYVYRVRTVCNDGPGDLSSTGTFVTQSDGCVPPVDLKLVSQGENSAHITWKAVEGAQRYEVAYRTATENTWERSIAIANNINLQDLKPQSNYLVKIRTFCDNGSSSTFSVTLQFNNVPEGTDCSKISDHIVVSAETNTTANVAWDKVSFAVTYELQLRIQGTEEWILGFVTPQTQFTAVGLTPNRLYEVRVRANCNFGTGSWSNVVRFKTTNGKTESDALDAFQNISIYPNPNRGIFNIQFEMNTTADLFFKLYDVTGKVILENKALCQIGENNIPIDLPNQAAGIYFLQMNLENNTKYIKVVIE